MWEHRQWLHPVTLMVLIGAISAGCLWAYSSENPLRVFVAVPVLGSLCSLVNLWNPFRIGALAGLWMIGLGLPLLGMWAAFLGLVLLVVSLLGWYVVIQRPNDKRLTESFRKR